MKPEIEGLLRGWANSAIKNRFWFSLLLTLAAPVAAGVIYWNAVIKPGRSGEKVEPPLAADARREDLSPATTREVWMRSLQLFGRERALARPR